jgi:hypothetical protein
MKIKSSTTDVSGNGVSGNGSAGGLAVAEAPMRPSASAQPKSVAYQALEAMASLRLTVVLFSMSLLLVFWGTWAQVDAGIWTVVNDYFRSPFVLIPLRTILFNIPEAGSALGEFRIPYPGGWLLGGLLLANVLAAHAIRFRFTLKRSGILLIHSGIIVMMLGEFFTGVFAVEGRMTIPEGQTTNWVDHDREVELAFVHRLEKEDHEIVVPQAFLQQGGLIQHPKLPVDVKVLKFMKNASLTTYQPAKHTDNPATTGIGLQTYAQEKAEVSGVGDQQVDLPTAYIELIDRDTQKSLGTYLVSAWFAFMQRPPDEVTVGDADWRVELRPKRKYRDYTIFLKRFHHNKFVGTETPKNFQSDVIVEDPETKERREVKIWMNHPLRYQGETFYQSSLYPLGKGTVLQVVRNPGWLLPYLACGMVSIGMLMHFGMHLREFLRRRMAV